MIGSGANKKSMAYIENISFFIDKCIKSDMKFKIFNYADSPDLSMNELVMIVRKVLKGKNSVGLRIPYFIGITIGLLSDIYNKFALKKFPISTIRIKKFCMSTVFISKNFDDNFFKRPFTLKKAIQRTLTKEFIETDPNQEIFYTE